MAESSQMQVKVISREKVVYEGPAKWVSSKNEQGKFDVLPEHANFISLVNAEVSIGEVNGQTVRFQVDDGVLRVTENKVEVFLGVRGTGGESGEKK